MVDGSSFTLGAIGMVTVAEAVGFLRGQATEALKRRRDTRDAIESTPVAEDPEDTTAELAVLDGPLDRRRIDPGLVDRQAAALERLREALDDDRVPGDDPALPGRVEALRALLEAAYGQRITFKGEDRPRTGTPLAPTAPGTGSAAGSVTAIGDGSVAVGGHNTGSIVVHR